MSRTLVCNHLTTNLTTTKGRSTEIHCVTSDWRARNNTRVRKQEEKNKCPYRGGIKRAQALPMRREGNCKEDRREHAGFTEGRKGIWC